MKQFFKRRNIKQLGIRQPIKHKHFRIKSILPKIQGKIRINHNRKLLINNLFVVVLNNIIMIMNGWTTSLMDNTRLSKERRKTLTLTKKILILKFNYNLTIVLNYKKT